MDEWVLDDLLECSVCLERLDTSSKVLPCQHTFCKKCLEEIHRTHNELRCPECRILVETKIEDLPPNVLLMRILEGIRNVAPEQSSNPGGGSIEPSTDGTVDKQHNLKTVTNDSKPRKFTNQPYARAIHDYPARELGELSFKKLDILYLNKKIDNNWFWGVDANGKAGFFPISYVQVIVPLPSQVPQCKALYDFKMTNDEEESCLAFVKGEIITVIRRVDENWAEGRLKDRIGIFPIAFVELNSVARSLMKLPTLDTQPGVSRVAPPAPKDNAPSDLQTRSPFSLPNDTTSDSSSTTVTSPSSSSSSTTPTPTTSSSLSPTSPSVSVSNSSKRHSFGSALPHSSLVKSKRRSAEIFISQNDSEQPLSLPADIRGDQTPPPQLERSGSQRYKKQAPPIPGPQIKHSSIQLPALYVALYPYKPQKADEIELKRGALYSVTERCQDGWFKGTLLRGQKTGVFPGNYVSPAKSLPAIQAQLRGIGRTKPFVSCSPSNGTPTVEPRNPMSYIKPQQMPAQPKGQETNRGASVAPEQQSTAVVPPPNVSVQALSKGHEKGNDKKENIVGIMRRLASLKKKSPPPTPYSMDNPVFEDSSVVFPLPVHVRSGSCPNQLITASSSESNSVPPHRIMSPSSSHRSKVRERPSLTPSIPPRYPAKSNVQHKKSSSMDTPGSFSEPAALLANSPAHFRCSLGDEISKTSSSSSPPSIAHNHSSSGEGLGAATFQPQSPLIDSSDSKPKSKFDSSSVDFRLAALRNTLSTNLPQTKPPCPKLPSREPSSSHSKNHPTKALVSRERFRCIVPYPPNSEYELELQIGDVIYVHKKREDGWYKGTQQRTGRTGLFPASFVQSF